MSGEEKDLAPTLRAVTQQLTEHNRVLGLLRQELKPVLEGWKDNANSVVDSLDAIAVRMKELVALSKGEVEEDRKRKEDISEKAAAIVGERIDAWIASDEGQEAITGTIGDVFESWLAEEREQLRKETEKDVTGLGPGTVVPGETGGSEPKKEGTSESI